MLGAMRIVSLLASGTELCCALGAGDELVGRSHECDYPEWVTALPVVSAPTFDVSGTSAQIDGLVRERLRGGRPLYQVDEELIARLAPDVLITQTHCEVCAVTPGDLAHGADGAAAAARLQRREVVALSAGTLAGILDGFRGVAGVLGRALDGEHLIDEIEGRQRSIAARVAGRRQPSVVCLEWIDPIFCMGNWGPELVARAGGENRLGVAGAHSTTAAWDDVRHADPDVLVVAPCGFAIDRTLREMPALAAQPGWRELRAVRDGTVFVADGNRYFNRSGPGVFDSVQILAEILHPEAVEPTLEGRAWVRYAA
jgi:iron complex transport system substrate-binding protein